MEVALDTRKCEIDLYWKRATYFWTVIASSFAGYFLVSKDNSMKEDAYLISCIGIIFSFSWYLVNRGSSSWQRNWEAHVEILEDSEIGPLFKTRMDRKMDRFIDLLSPYPYSPSRINAIMSLSVTGAWGFFILRYWQGSPILMCNLNRNDVLVSLITVAFAAILLLSGRAKSGGYKSEAIYHPREISS